MDSTEAHIKLVADEYHNLCFVLLSDQPDEEMADAIFAELQTVSNTEMAGELAFRYNYFKGLYLTKLGYIQQARPFLLSAATYKPDNVESLSTLCANIIAGAEFEHYPDLSDTLTSYEEKLPALKDLRLWQTGSANALLKYSYDQMGAGNVHVAKKALASFEHLMDANPGLDVVGTNIGVAYCRVALYDFKSSKSRAMKVINKGLEYAPGNTDLIKMRKLIN